VPNTKAASLHGVVVILSDHRDPEYSDALVWIALSDESPYEESILLAKLMPPVSILGDDTPLSTKPRDHVLI
jgi:hypothetical protein